MPSPNYIPWREYTGGYKKSAGNLEVLTNAFRAVVNSVGASFSSWEDLQKGFIESTYNQVTDDAIASRKDELSSEDEVKLAERLILEFMYPEVIRDFHSQAAKDQEREDYERESELERQRNELIQQASIVVKQQLIDVLSSEQVFLQAMLNLQQDTNLEKPIHTALIDRGLIDALNKLQEEAAAQNKDDVVDADVPEQSTDSKEATPDNAAQGFNWRMFGFVILCVLGVGLPLFALISDSFRKWVTRADEPVSIDKEKAQIDETASQATTETTSEIDDEADSAQLSVESHHKRHERPSRLQDSGHFTFFDSAGQVGNSPQTVDVNSLEQELCNVLTNMGIKNDPPEYSAHLIALYAKRNMQAANPSGEVVINPVNGKLHLSIAMDEPVKYFAMMHKTGKIGTPDIEVLTRNADGNFTLTIDTQPESIDLNRSFKPDESPAKHVNRICRFEFEPGSKVKRPFGEEHQAETNRFIKGIEQITPPGVSWFVNVRAEISTAMGVAPEVTDITEESFFEYDKELRSCITAAELMSQGRELNKQEVAAYAKNMEKGYYWLDRFARLLPVDIVNMNAPMEYSNVVSGRGAPVLTRVLMMGDHHNDADWRYRKKSDGEKKRTPEDIKGRKKQSACPTDLRPELHKTALDKQVNFSRTVGTEGIITTLELPEQRRPNGSRLAP